jgi:uncharacterized protein YbjT (DUF2867 family)
MILPNMKTITVLGALGGQGGSVVKSFLVRTVYTECGSRTVPSCLICITHPPRLIVTLFVGTNRQEDGSFRIRGVTSSPESDSAKALQAKGVQMISGNVKEPETLTKAFTGADVAFIVVNFWDPEILNKEGELTKQIMDVAKTAGVKHVIYSSLANVKKVSNDKIDVPHFTLKAEAMEYLQTLGFETITAVEPAAYYSNWFTFFKPVEAEDGTLVWTWPGKGEKVSQYDAATATGPSVLAAAKNPKSFNGKNILLEADLLSPEDIVSIISKKLGKPGRVDYADPEEFSKLFPGARELAEMAKFFDQYGYYGPETEERKHSSGREIGPMMTFEAWMDTEEYKKYM